VPGVIGGMVGSSFGSTLTMAGGSVIFALLGIVVGMIGLPFAFVIVMTVINS
jgi:hypothetical protein